MLRPPGEARSNWKVFGLLARAVSVAREHYARTPESPTVLIAPDDAVRRGIGDGDLVRVFNGRGLNVLTSDRVTDMGGGPAFHSNLVDVAPL